MSIRTAVVGCCHGELNTIYAKITALPKSQKPELLIVCGDFQSLRSKDDFRSIAMPDKYKQLGDFHEYYEGKKEAPVLTLFIGGNHECGDYLTALPFGGWVAPKIWYMGFSGVVWYKGLRIGGISGIFKEFDFYRERFEMVPLDGRSVRSVYHTRFQEVLKMSLIRDLNMNCFISHDWPEGIAHYGDLERLLKRKPFFKKDIEKGELGNPHYMNLLRRMTPNYWFSAHLHVKFEANVSHEKGKRKMSDDGKDSKRIRGAVVTESKNDDEIELGMSDNEDELKLDLSNEDEIELEIDQVVPSSRSKDLAKGFSQTNFLALSKPLPSHPFFEVLEIPVTNEHEAMGTEDLYYDREYLKITKWAETFTKTQGFKRLRMDQLTGGAMEQMWKDIALVNVACDLRVGNKFEATRENPMEQTAAFKQKCLILE